MKRLIMLLVLLSIVGCNNSANDKKNVSDLQNITVNDATHKEQSETSNADNFSDDNLNSAMHDEPLEVSKISLYKKYLLSEKNEFKSILLPFSMMEYLLDFDSDDNYSYYTPSDNLIDFFVSIDYEGEKYKCFILTTDSDNLSLLVHIQRGDSDYFFIVLANYEGVITHKDVNVIGDDEITFILNKDLTVYLHEIDQSLATVSNGKVLQKFLIEDDKIIEIK